MLRITSDVRQGLVRGGGRPVQLVLRGPTYETLAQWRDRMLRRMDDNPRLLNVDSDYKETLPQIRVEIDKARQVMYLIQNGVTMWTFNVSTGSEVPYRVVYNGQTYTGDAQTYDGTFKINRANDGGWTISELGQLWRPRFFNGGIAIHGSLDIPGQPASHGCVRVSIAAMNWLWGSNSLPFGMTVTVYSD